MKNKLFLSWAAFLTLSTTLLSAQEEPSPPQPRDDFMQTLIMVGIAVVFFYFIIYRPEQKRRKQMDDLRGTLKKGDKVVAMGLQGEIDKVEDETVVLKLVEGKVRILKGAISEVETKVETKEGANA